MTTMREEFEKAMAAYRPGGSFEKTAFADIETGKKRAIGGAVQGLVSGGMAGSSLMGSVPLVAEKSAAGSRLKVSAEREQRLSGLQTQLASLIAQMEEAQRQRDFAAEQSYFGRQHQTALQTSAQEYGAAQTALERAARINYATPSKQYSATTPSAQSLPSLYGETTGTTASTRLNMPKNIFGGASGTPGEFAGSVNGERYVYNTEGQIVKESELSPAAIGKSLLTSLKFF